MTMNYHARIMNGGYLAHLSPDEKLIERDARHAAAEIAAEADAEIARMREAIHDAAMHAEGALRGRNWPDTLTSVHEIIAALAPLGPHCRNCGTALTPDDPGEEDDPELRGLCNACADEENNAAYHEGQWRDG